MKEGEEGGAAQIQRVLGPVHPFKHANQSCVYGIFFMCGYGKGPPPPAYPMASSCWMMSETAQLGE